MVHPFGPVGDEKLLVNDASGYHNIAVRLIQKGSYPPHDDYLSMLRTIGYPVFVAAIYTLFGIHPWVVILLQIILDSLFTWVIIRFALLLNLDKSAFIAGFLWAIDPLAIIYSNALLSDSLFVWLITGGIYFILKYFLDGRNRYLYINASLFALAAHVRPVGLYLFFLIALILLIKAVVDKRALTWLSYTLLFTILIAPWMIRNKVQHDHYFFSISGDYNMLILYAAPLYANSEGIGNNVKNILEDKMAIKYAELKEKDPYLFYGKYKDEGLAIIMKNPYGFIKQTFIKSVQMFMGTDRVVLMSLLFPKKENVRIMDTLLKNNLSDAIKKILKSISFAEIFFLTGYIFLLFTEYIFAVLGICYILRGKKYNLLFILSILSPMFFLAAIGMPIGFTRFKLPFIPIYLVLVAIGVYQFRNKKQSSQKEFYYV